MFIERKDNNKDDLPELTDITKDVTFERENYILDLEEAVESTSDDELTPELSLLRNLML